MLYKYIKKSNIPLKFAVQPDTRILVTAILDPVAIFRIVQFFFKISTQYSCNLKGKKVEKILFLIYVFFDHF